MQSITPVTRKKTSTRNEKKAFENGFSNVSFGGTNVNRCLTEDFTKSEDGSQCSSEGEAWHDDVTLQAQPAAPATCSMINTPLSEMDEHDERDLVVFAMVARPVTKAERLVNAKAMASLDKEWNKLENQRVWIVEKGRSWREVAEEARAKGEVAHVGRIFDICVDAGLMQFSSSSLLNISVPCLIKALGNNYMSSIAGFIRRWRTGLASVGPSNFGHHVVVPPWGSEDWVCSGLHSWPSLGY